jgi:hypothetical protein
MSGATGHPGSAGEAVSAQQKFQSPWPVKTCADVARFKVKVPATTLQKRGLPPTYKPPDYLRLEVRRRNFRKLTPRPVLRSIPGPGSSDTSLLVSNSLASTIADSGDIAVSGATEKAFRWYRFTHSSGPALTTVASVIGALLVALGALWFTGGLGKGLVIAGVALTALSAVGVVVATWQAPIEGA